MTRIALAQTLVTGTVTLQGKSFTFSASGSAQATADKVNEAKKLAIMASNSAAIIAARASINKILTDNSAVLTDLEITSLISNNLSTTVLVYRPIALNEIASSTDGINYIINPNTTLGKGRLLTVPSGKTLLFNSPFKSYGYIQIGDGPTDSTRSKALVTEAQATYAYNPIPSINYGTLMVYNICNIETQFINETGGCLIIDAKGTCNIQGGAPYGADWSQIDNVGVGSYVKIFGMMKLAADHNINNLGDNSFVHLYNGGTIYQPGGIRCNLYGVPVPGAYAINEGIAKNVYSDCPLWVRTPPV